MTKQQQIALKEDRINLLASNGKPNNAIINKLKREIKKLQTQ